MFLEHKLLYLGQAEPVPEQPYAIPLGTAAIRRQGRDVTVIATQAMVQQALLAATRLEGEGISVEVIDPRTLRPLDLDTIVASVKRTNRLVVVHEGWKFGGFGGEIAAAVTEEAFDWLDAPVVRVGALDVPMPFNDRLERAVIPSADKIVAAIRGLFG
jgi:2-oxoisovalerate dehydrogenase E1 component